MSGETRDANAPSIFRSKEFLAGFWIIEAPNLDVALELAAVGSKACNRKIELRPFGVLEE